MAPQSELRQLKELHQRMQAAVDDVERIRDEASAVSDELSARRRDVLMQLETLRQRIDYMGGLDGPPSPRRS
jgi:phage FluMu protein gp41